MCIGAFRSGYLRYCQPCGHSVEIYKTEKSSKTEKIKQPYFSSSQKYFIDEKKFRYFVFIFPLESKCPV